MIKQFRKYLVDNGYNEENIQNIISRLKYLISLDNLPIVFDGSIITIDMINKTEQWLVNDINNREKYQSIDGIKSLKSALNRFSDYTESTQDTFITNLNEEGCKNLIDSIERDTETLSNEEKKTLIKYRIGQGKFRRELRRIYNDACVISGINFGPLLIASHIKPWLHSNNIERIDPYNGLLLIPNYDKLFDLGLISFDEKGQILISSLLKENEIKEFKLSSLITIKLHKQSIPYMEFHRNQIFKK